MTFHNQELSGEGYASHRWGRVYRQPIRALCLAQDPDIQVVNYDKLTMPAI